MVGPATSRSDCPLHRRGRVEVDEPAHAVGGPVGDARDHHAAVAVPHEDHVGEVLVVQEVDDVGDVEVEIDVPIQQV